jgi:hypothetical protein
MRRALAFFPGLVRSLGIAFFASALGLRLEEVGVAERGFFVEAAMKLRYHPASRMGWWASKARAYLCKLVDGMICRG